MFSLIISTFLIANGAGTSTTSIDGFTSAQSCENALAKYREAFYKMRSDGNFSNTSIRVVAVCVEK